MVEQQAQAEAEEEMMEADEEPAFISPRAEHPQRRPHVVETAQEEEYYEEEEDESSFSFFERIAGVGKALAAKPEPKRPTSGGAGRAQVSEKPSALSEEDEEYLDIPAFLRRQAN